MALRKHEIPILEYDDSPSAVLEPAHEDLGLALPQRAVLGFLYDSVDRYAIEQGFRQAGSFVSATKTYPVWVGEFAGKPVCLVQAPVGASAAAQLMDWLIGYGVRKIMAAGSCGALTDLPENAFLVPVRALRDEGTSYHYAPPSRYMEMDPEVTQVIEDVLLAHGLPCRKVTTWSTDGFFRETEEKVACRREEGCQVVEMECSALAAVAQFRGISFGQLLFTADTLAAAQGHDSRDWGRDSRAPALISALEALVRL